MAASAVKVLVVDGKEITQSVDLRTTKQGSATKVKAIKGGKFILADADTGAAPENITAHRVGNDLHVSLEGTGYEDPELIIEGYYSEDGQGDQLVGVAEDGAYYEYIASDAEATHEAGMLGEGVTSPLVLGRNPLLGFGSGLVPAAGLGWLGMGLLGLGALGLIGAAIEAGKGGGGDGGGGGGDDGGNPGNPGGGNGDKLVIGAINDNVGSITGPIPDHGVTDDTTPTIIGTGGTPGKVVTIVDNGNPIGSTIVKDDGSWEFTPDKPLPEGSHEIVVIEDGKPPSEGHEIIVDTTAPGQVSIESVLDDAGSVTGFLANGGMTDDTTPTLSGKAEAGSLVTLYDNGTVVGSVMADADGNWTLTPEVGDGTHSFTATATDAAGNVGLPSDPWVVIVDTFEGKPAIGDVIDDFGPTTGSIPSGGSTDDNTPTLEGGRLTPGSTVVISDGGKPIGSTIVKDDGSWEFTPNPPLDDGKHDFTVVVTDPVGNVSVPSDPWTVIIDTIAPDAPKIVSVIDNQGAVTGDLTSGDTTDDASPVLHGTAEVNSLVTIYDGSKAIGSTMADGNGDWTFEPPFPLGLGLHNLTAKATDAAGNISDPSNEFDLTVDTGGIPTSPAIIGVTDDFGPITGNVAPHGVTDDNTPTVIGTAPAGAIVMVYLDGSSTPLGSVVADANGKWSFPVTTPLADGDHNFSATATVGGAVSVPTGDYPITVDTHAPAASTGNSLIDDVGPQTGEIHDNDTTDDANPTYSGKAEPGTTVHIYDKGVEVGTAKVDASGDWTFTPSTPLRDGAHEFTNTVVDAAGNTSPESTPVHFIVDTSGVAIAITQVNDDFGSVTGPISLGGVTDDKTPTVNGTATANSVIHIFVDDVEVGSTTSNAAGNWSFTTPDLSEAHHVITATAVNPATGVVSDSNQFDLTIDFTPPGKPEIGDIQDNVGTVTGTIPDHGSTDDTTPTLVGGGQTPGDTVTIIDNGDPIGTAIVGDDGKWEFTPNPPLNQGDHEFTVIVTDPAGNASVPSDPWTVVIDTDAPNAPVITHVIDDQGAVTGDLTSGDITDDASPELHGTAEPNSLVTLYDGSKAVGSAMADGSGNWIITPDLPLGLGAHNLTVKASDAAGNVSDPSNDFDLTVDTGGVPTSPAIIGVTDDVGAITGNVAPHGVTDDNTPTIVGTAPAGAIVMIYLDGSTTPLGSVVSDTDGKWWRIQLVDATL